jgi:hypothetical protein
MVIDGYRKVWVFAQRLRRGDSSGSWLICLRHIAAHDSAPRVRVLAARQLADLDPRRDHG